MSTNNQQFASDNYSGICPEVWEAMSRANQGHERAYGDDQWTARAADHFRQLFETDCEAFFAFNGTAANSLALSALCQSYHSVICADIAHVETDECGAPEFFSNGSKLLTAPSVNGKLTPESIREVALKRQDIHYPKPRVPRGQPDPGHRDRYRLSARRTARHQPDLQGAEPPPAYGWGAFCQRLCLPGPVTGGAELESRRGCALFRRHQERHGSG